MEYGQCLRCKKYRMNPNTCQCKVFSVWLGEDWGQTEQDAISIYADNAEEAAEEFCHKFDSSGDYAIIGRGYAEVIVMLDNEELQFRIEAYSTPNYHATVMDTIPKVC